MLQLRIVAPVDLAPTALTYLETLDGVADLAHFPGASRRPVGDVIQCVVSSDVASAVIAALEQLGIESRGSIVVDRLEARVAFARDTEEKHAHEGVVWEEVEAKTHAMTKLTLHFLVYMMAATVIAAIAIITDSVVLIIGAMVVGPEFGPLCGLSVGLVHGKRDLVREALISLGLGFLLAFVASFVVTVIFIVSGIAPTTLAAEVHPTTLFISRPDAYTVVVAVLCGVVGMLSLTTASAGTLIGVLISVTTIPAAANVGVATAYGNGDEAWGALIQLGVNLVAFQATGMITLRIQRAGFATRAATFVEKLRDVRLRRRRI